MKSARNLTFDRLPTTFDGLIKRHPPRPIHQEVGYKNTVQIVDALAGHSLNRDQDDYLQVLAGLIERYETDTLRKRPRVSGLEMLRYVLDENGLRADDLAKIIGVDRSVANRVLTGERKLSITHLKALRAQFGVPVEVFLS